MTSLKSVSTDTERAETIFDKSPIVELLVQEKILNAKQLEYASRVLAKLETSKPVLEVLKELDFVDDVQIKDTVCRCRVPMCIGSLLVELGCINSEDVQRALKIQGSGQDHKKLGEILLEHHLIDERSLIEALSVL